MAGLSGGARGLPAGRPGAAGPGEWVAWGKGRELSPLETHSYPPAASCPAPGIRQLQLSLWGRLPGASGGRSFCLRPASGFPTPGSLRPHPLPGAAAREPPPRHPVPPCALHTGSFRLGSPRSPGHPLGSPRSSPLRTHTPRFVEVPPLGSPLASSFSRSEVPPALFSGAPDPSFPLGPLRLLVRRELCPDLGTGSTARLWGPVWAGVPGKTGPGSEALESAHVLCIQMGLGGRSDWVRPVRYGGAGDPAELAPRLEAHRPGSLWFMMILLLWLTASSP